MNIHTPHHHTPSPHGADGPGAPVPQAVLLPATLPVLADQADAVHEHGLADTLRRDPQTRASLAEALHVLGHAVEDPDLTRTDCRHGICRRPPPPLASLGPARLPATVPITRDDIRPWLMGMRPDTGPGARPATDHPESDRIDTVLEEIERVVSAIHSQRPLGPDREMTVNPDPPLGRLGSLALVRRGRRRPEAPLHQ